MTEPEVEYDKDCGCGRKKVLRLLMPTDPEYVVNAVRHGMQFLCAYRDWPAVRVRLVTECEGWETALNAKGERYQAHLAKWGREAIRAHDEEYAAQTALHGSDRPVRQKCGTGHIGSTEKKLAAARDTGPAWVQNADGTLTRRLPNGTDEHYTPTLMVD